MPVKYLDQTAPPSQYRENREKAGARQTNPDSRYQTDLHRWKKQAHKTFSPCEGQMNPHTRYETCRTTSGEMPAFKPKAMAGKQFRRVASKACRRRPSAPEVSKRPASRCQGETWVCGEEITCSGRALPGPSDRLINGNLLRESSLSPEEI
ncbi:unnamed protein product [Leuciscus chuanchicus]